MRMTAAGPTTETRPTVVMLMVSGWKRKEMLGSRREKGRLYRVTKLRPAATAATALWSIS